MYLKIEVVFHHQEPFDVVLESLLYFEQKKLDLKEIKITPKISENDLNYRVKHIIEFLNKGHKVKITMEFKGREISYIDNANALFLKLLISLEDYSIPEFLPKLEGKKMFSILKPKK
jgi:translation initiation factor IF-3